MNTWGGRGLQCMYIFSALKQIKILRISGCPSNPWKVSNDPLTLKPQGRQSAKLFLQPSELGVPQQPPTRRRVCHPPLVPRWRGTLAGKREVGASQFRRGYLHCGTLYIFVLCALNEAQNSIPGVWWTWARCPPAGTPAASPGSHQTVCITWSGRFFLHK